MLSPDFMPVLSTGGHKDPQDGACIMEYISFLAGEKFSDMPMCTDSVLASLARTFNDSIDDDDRHLMLPFIPRLLGSSLGYPAYVPVYAHLRIWLLCKTLPFLPTPELRMLGGHAITDFLKTGRPYPHNSPSVFQPDRDRGRSPFSPRSEYARRIFARALGREGSRGLIEALVQYPRMIYVAHGTAAKELLSYFTEVIDEFDAAAGRTPASPLTDATLLRCRELTS